MARILTALAAALFLAPSAQAQVMIYPSMGIGTMPTMRSIPMVGYSPVINTAPIMPYSMMGYRPMTYRTSYGNYGVYNTYNRRMSMYTTPRYPTTYRATRGYRRGYRTGMMTTRTVRTGRMFRR